ncbi:hypothetical protein EKTHUN627_32340 [Enterobacter kobei]|nr:hypothetical protein EKTHUN627_32340 [Enterobacter kobei]
MLAYSYRYLTCMIYPPDGKGLYGKKKKTDTGTRNLADAPRDGHAWAGDEPALAGVRQRQLRRDDPAATRPA